MANPLSLYSLPTVQSRWLFKPIACPVKEVKVNGNAAAAMEVVNRPRPWVAATTWLSEDLYCSIRLLTFPITAEFSVHMVLVPADTEVDHTPISVANKIPPFEPPVFTLSLPGTIMAQYTGISGRLAPLLSNDVQVAP